MKKEIKEKIIESWEKEFDELLKEKLFPYPCQECGLGQNGETTELVKSFIRQLLEKERQKSRFTV